MRLFELSLCLFESTVSAQSLNDFERCAVASVVSQTIYLHLENLHLEFVIPGDQSAMARLLRPSPLSAVKYMVRACLLKISVF